MIYMNCDHSCAKKCIMKIVKTFSKLVMSIKSMMFFDLALTMSLPLFTKRIEFIFRLPTASTLMWFIGRPWKINMGKWSMGKYPHRNVYLFFMKNWPFIATQFGYTSVTPTTTPHNRRIMNFSFTTSQLALTILSWPRN